MTWFRFDDNAVDHPKVESLSDRAFRWWVRGLSYASRFLTNGVLPPIFWKKTPSNCRNELSNGGLWDWHDPNFHIHDYDKYQTLKGDVEHQRERNREKNKTYRDNKRSRVTGHATVTSIRSVTEPPDITEQEQTPPLPPSAEGGVTVTREDRKEARRIRGDRDCDHEPPCETYTICIEHIAVWIASERAKARRVS